MNSQPNDYSDVTVVPDALRVEISHIQSDTSILQNRLSDLNRLTPWGRAYDEMAIIAGEVLHDT